LINGKKLPIQRYFASVLAMNLTIYVGEVEE